MTSTSRTLPKLATQKSWKTANPHLAFDREKMWCTICTKFEDKLKSCKNFNVTFIEGSQNFRLSAVKQHASSEMHDKALRLNDQEEAEKAGERYVTNLNPSGPTAIGESLKKANKLQEQDREYLEKLFEVSYYIAVKGRPYSDFEDLVKLEKLHGVNFSPSDAYEHRNACKTFIEFSSKCIFEKTVKDKLLRSNFVSVLCDGSTDNAVVEKECIYVLYVFPDTFTPVCSFFSLQDPLSQDAPGIYNAIQKAFRDNGLEKLLPDSMVFFASDGASVNAGDKNGLIVLFRDVCPWVVFVWCVSHRLELAIKHGLKGLIDPIDTCLKNLYYLYEKSSKKTREIKILHDVLKGVLEFENGVVKPHRAAGTRGIAHKLMVLENMLDKFGMYLSHLENIIADTSKKTDKATLEGKRRQLVSANVVLLGSVFYDLLEPARQLSLFTQKENITLHEVTEVLEGTRKRYVQLLKKFKDHPDAVFKLPRLAQTLSKVEKSNQFDFYKYQGIKLTNFTQHKNSLPSKSVKICEGVVNTLNKYFEEFRSKTTDVDDNDDEEEDLMRDITDENGNDDKVLFHIAKVINTSSWITASSDDLVKSMNFVFTHFSEHPVIKSLNLMTLETEFLQLVDHAKRCHPVADLRPLNLWKILHATMKSTGRFDNIFLLIELCLVTPYANAQVERFFNYMKIVKTDWRCSLGASSLEHLLRIRVEGPDLLKFSEEFCSDAVSMWWDDRQRRLTQGKRSYTKRKVKESKRPKFTNEFIEEFLASDEEMKSDCDEEDIGDEL